MHNNPYQRRVTTRQLKARPRERLENSTVSQPINMLQNCAPRDLIPIINKRLLNIYG